MAGGIVINGRFVARPGIYSNINYITIPGAPTQGTVLAVVGDLPFLQQGVPYLSTSQREFEAIAPQSALLKKMSGIIYNPLADANLSAAPAAVYLLSPRGNTQAALRVTGTEGSDPEDGIVAKSLQWGVVGNSTSLKITANVPRGGWDAVVANNGTQEKIRIASEATPLVLDYDSPYTPTTVVQAPIEGFGDWEATVLDAFGDPTQITVPGSLKAELGEIEAGSPGTLRVSFARNIAAEQIGTGSGPITAWLPKGPVYGPVTISSLGNTIDFAGCALRLLVTGVNLANGLTESEAVEFSIAQLEAEVSKTTTRSFASVDSVLMSITEGSGGPPTLSGAGMLLTGNCFPDMNAANGQRYVSDVLRIVQQYSDKGFLASTLSSRVSSIKLTDLDVLPETAFGAEVSDDAVSLTANGWKIVTTINAASKLITLERGNAEDPSTLVAAFFGRLAGGTESGVLVAGDWGDALDSLVWYNVDTVAAFYDPSGTPAADDVVLAQFKEHIDQMWADGANERTLWLGAGQDEDLDTLVQRAAVFNSERVNVVVDSAYIQQPDGSSELMKPYWYALMLAASDASLLAVETLTRARPRVLGTERAEGLEAQEDVNELIRGGLIISTTPPGAATRIEREVTTWTADTNPARTEAICTRSVRASTKAMRAALDGLIQPGAGVLVLADVKATVLSELERQARSVSPLITNYDAASVRISELADRYEIGYIITVRINKNFITLNVGVTVPVGTI